MKYGKYVGHQKTRNRLSLNRLMKDSKSKCNSYKGIASKLDAIRWVYM
jgi:hypothetical protein